jgi:hypothetical protein
MLLLRTGLIGLFANPNLLVYANIKKGLSLSPKKYFINQMKDILMKRQGIL